MRNKILLAIIFVILIAGIILHQWIIYVSHLAYHQFSSILKRQQISYLITSPDITEFEKQKFLKIQKVRDFGKQLYGLKESHCFEYYVKLPRDTLGWNLTMAPELELKAKEYGFPIIGKFGYLGFFSEKLKTKWSNVFANQGYDVYENAIGAYSTLGYFRDPIYSTYLKFDEKELLSLILHEMVHEKLYFKNDSDFSESMASFMERTALNLFLYKQTDPPADILEKHKNGIAEYKAFLGILDSTKKRLDTLYNSNLPRTEKLAEKKKELENLRMSLQTRNFQYLTYANDIAKMKNLNNAFLVQHSRYTPKRKSGFSRLLKDCKNDVQCWFTKLEKLQACDQNIRKHFLEEEISLDAILLQCKN